MTWSYYITPEQYEMAAKNGINRKHVDERVRKCGWHIEKAITKPVNRHTDNTEWIKKAAENGVSRNTFYVRIRKGMSKEEAATRPTVIGGRR